MMIKINKAGSIQCASETIDHWANLGKLDVLAQELTVDMPSMFDKVYDRLSELALERWEAIYE